MSNSVLIIFAREPKDGRVKTRLAESLPVRTVTRIYEAFVKDVLAVAREVPCGRRFIFYDHDSASIPFLRRVGKGFSFKRQSGGDLGERMLKAFEYCHKRGYGRVVIIGTDCLTMGSEDITIAFQQLASQGCVLGPAEDGGYYLIGLRRPCPGVFQGVAWGTRTVLRKTLNNAAKLQQAVYLLPKREDIDRFVQLKKFFRNNHKDSRAIYTKNVLGLLGMV